MNEYPYLDKPEILEFPNETWVVQDLRKSVVFYKAAKYAGSEQEKKLFLHKARLFFEYVNKELPKHPGRRYSRSIALMLQNGWCGERLKEQDSVTDSSAPGRTWPESLPHGKPTPYLTISSVMNRFILEMFQAFRQTNLRREMAWLLTRLRG